MDQWLKARPNLHALGRNGETGVHHGMLVHTVTEVASAIGRCFPPDNIFFCPPYEADVNRVLDQCRFVAGSLEDLRFLERSAESAGAARLLSVGLRLQSPDLPPVGNAVLPDQLAGYACVIRSLRHLTVRGCFFCGDLTGVHGEALGRFFRAGYETAKRMTVTLPCAMPYLCYEGGIAAIRKNAELHPETLDDCLRALDIMMMQNETAFYAKLYMS